MAATSSVAPSDEELSPVVTKLRTENPSTGVPKLLQQLKSEHSDWAVSEKRLRKLLQTLNLPSTAVDSTGGDVDGETGLVADTGLDPSINVGGIAPKVKARMFGGEKGKGLVARDKILQGEVIWSEEPWIVTADPDLYQYLLSKRMCGYCFTMFPMANPSLSVPCGHCDSAHFCNRLCLAKARSSGAHHDLMCPGQNDRVLDLLKFIHARGGRHLDAVAKIIANWRSARDWTDTSEGGEGEGKAKDIENRIWGGMARISIEKKEMERREWEYVGELRRKEWTEAHSLLVKALNPKFGTPAWKAYSKLSTQRHPKRHQPKPLTVEEEDRWFSFESFLQLLGLATLNQEDSGGLYALHAHLNHSCEPNLQARNLPKTFVPPPQSALPCELPPPLPAGVRGTNRLTMVARRTINPGDELTLPYVNFNMERDDRRKMLRELYGFWCSCPKCQREKNKPKASAKVEESEPKPAPEEEETAA